MKRTAVAGVFALALAAGEPAALFAQGSDRGCTEPRLVSTGGEFPRAAQTLAVRWTGFSNFELAYKGRVILLDAYFDRGSIFPPLGFAASDITRADVILIGHGHFDHMSDAASVAKRTGAVVVGAPLTAQKLLAQGVAAAKVRSVTGTGSERLTFENFTVEPILARHGEPPPDVTGAFNQALRQTAPRPTPEQTEEQRTIRERGVNDPRVVGEGTIAYVITLDDGFRIGYRDSGGVVTEQEKTAMARLGRVDLAIMATAASVLPTLTSRQAVEYARTYKPSIFIPAHHDGSVDELWRPTEPLFQAIKDENPATVTVSKGYREPSCFDTTPAARRR